MHRTARTVRVAAGVLLAGSLAWGFFPDEGEHLLVEPRLTQAPDRLAIPGEVIVQFEDTSDEAREEQAIRAAGGIRARRSAFGRRYLVRLAEGVGEEESLRRLASFPGVRYAERNAEAWATLAPNDRLY